MNEDHLPIHLSLAERVAALLPNAQMERTRDVGEIALGDEEEGAVVLLFLPDELDVRHRVVTWPHPHTPMLTTRRWKRVKYGRLNETHLLRLVGDARAAWDARLGVCKHCGKRFPPERMIRTGDEGCCHGCAERHEHVVF